MTELEIIINRVYFLAITELVMAAAELVVFAFLAIIYFKIRRKNNGQNS